MWHQATAKGKKVLLATQTWRNSSDMPVSRSNPTFLGSPRRASWLAAAGPLRGAARGPRGVRGWTSKESTGKTAEMTR